MSVPDTTDAVTGAAAPLLEVRDLHVEFTTGGRVLRANDGVSYEVRAGETLAIIGETGSGKSVSAGAIMGMIESPGRVAAGSITFDGRDLRALDERQYQRIRGERIAMVFQDAQSSLNPVMTVGDQIGEMFRVHRGASAREARQRAVELMDRVRIPAARSRAKDYPHQFSGGMRQRVMIAIALSLEPELLIADEPTTALDVTVQAQIMRLLASLQEESNMALILISHDLAVVADVADRIAVMYAGKIVEIAPTDQIYARPSHPYTRGLMAAIPSVATKGKPLGRIAGSPPDLAALPSGCSFHPRCPFARAICRDEAPGLLPVGGSRSACHFREEVMARALKR